MAKKHEDPQRGIICRRDDRHHFRMYESLVHSDVFKKLSNPAKVAYMLMGLQAKGRPEFAFPQTAYIEFMSKPTFIKAKRELVKNGFIVEKRCGYLTVRYRLSNEWQNKKIPSTVKQSADGIGKKEFDYEL